MQTVDTASPSKDVTAFYADLGFVLHWMIICFVLFLFFTFRSYTVDCSSAIMATGGSGDVLAK